MKSFKLVNGQVILTEIPEPQIQRPTDVKIKVSCASLCGYEMDIYKGKITGILEENLGHEASGIVVETGASVTDLHPGDRVVLSPYSSCGHCLNCRKGLRRYCTNQYMDPYNFMAEYVILPQQQALPVPDNLTMQEACLTEPLSVSLRAVEKAHLRCGSRLLIIGGGAMGLLCLKAALTYPLSGAVVLEPSESKRKLAMQLGASMALDPSTDDLYYHLMDYTQGLGFDAVIEASGKSAWAEPGFNLVAHGGSLILLSMYEVGFQLQIPVLNLYWKDASIQAVFPSADSMNDAIHLAPRLNLGNIITTIMPFHQAPDAFRLKASDPNQLKVMLQLPE